RRGQKWRRAVAARRARGATFFRSARPGHGRRGYGGTGQAVGRTGRCLCGQEIAHMPNFAANLSMLWPELDVYDRFRAAAEAGFSRVEILFVHALDQERVARLLKEHRLELVLFDPEPGNWDAGERGLLSLPGREEEFHQSVSQALEAAKLFGTKRLNAIAGVLPPGVNRSAAEKTAVDNLRRAAPIAESAGVLLLVENIK